MLSTLKNLMTSEESKDVTLVCEDGTQFTAHKFMLSSSSPFFQRMFSNRGSYDRLLPSMVYLPGIQADILEGLLKFIYLGQVFLEQPELKSFMTAAKILKIAGLSELYSPPTSTSPGPSPSPPLTPSPSNDINNIGDKDQVDTRGNHKRMSPGFIVPSNPPVTSSNEKFQDDPYQLLQERSKTRNDPLQDFIDGLLMIKQEPKSDNTAEQPIIALTPPPEELPVLTFETPTKSSNTSIESAETPDDMERNSHPMVVAGKETQFSTKPKMYYCQQCDYKSAKHYNVKKHTLAVHDKVKYPCTYCTYQATETGHLKKHMRTVHKELDLDTTVPALQHQ